MIVGMHLPKHSQSTQKVLVHTYYVPTAVLYSDH